MKKQKHRAAKRREAITGLLFVSPWDNRTLRFLRLSDFPLLTAMLCKRGKYDGLLSRMGGLDHFKEIFDDRHLVYKALPYKYEGNAFADTAYQYFRHIYCNPDK